LSLRRAPQAVAAMLPLCGPFETVVGCVYLSIGSAVSGARRGDGLRIENEGLTAGKRLKKLKKILSDLGVEKEAG